MVAGVQVAGEQTPFERAHGGLLGRLRVVQAADVKCAVGDQQAQLVGRGPADVAGLTATTGFGLLGGPLDRHDDVTERGPATRRQREVGRRRQREGQDVGRTLVAKVRLVQLGQLRVVGQDQPDRRRGGAPAASRAAAIARARPAAGTGETTPSRTVMSTRHGPV